MLDDPGDDERNDERNGDADAKDPAGDEEAAGDRDGADASDEVPGERVARAGSSGDSPSIHWELVESSFDEAEFLWKRRELYLHSHRHDLEGVAVWAEDR